MEEAKFSGTENVSPVQVIKPVEGFEVLELNQIENTVPPKNGAWIPIDQYDLKMIAQAELLKNSDHDQVTETDETIEITCESIADYRLEVYRHKPIGDWVLNDSENKKLWEAFDIVYEPEWKKVAAKYLGGLTDSEIAIVRLLKNDGNGTGIAFCSLYINNNMYSKYFSNQRRLQREGQVDPNIEISISYEINSCMASSGTDFPALISAFTYMYQLNGNRSFPIIEQIRDYRNTGSKVLISNFDPKTEIREEFNIFANAEQPESVLTNFKPQIFMCDFDKSTNSFVITKKRG